MPKRSYELNKRGIRKMTRAIEKDWAKNPVRIPVQAEISQPLSLTDRGTPPANVVHHGPVFYGGISGSSVAWGNGTAKVDHAPQAAPGYEELAEALIGLLAGAMR